MKAYVVMLSDCWETEPQQVFTNKRKAEDFLARKLLGGLAYTQECYTNNWGWSAHTPYYLVEVELCS